MSGNTSEVGIPLLTLKTINLCCVKPALYFAEQGYYWKEAQIEVSKRIQAIRIRATTGMSGPKGDMAIDDVKVSSQFTQLFTFFYVQVSCG